MIRFAAVLFVSLASWASAGEDISSPAATTRVSETPPAKTRVAVAPATVPERKVFRIDQELVLVPVTVTDSRNGFVTGLRRENFRVFESRREQQLLFFSTEDTPVSVGIIFDVSESMSGKLTMARQAVASFLRTLNPADEVFLVAFNGRPTLVQDFTSDSALLQSRLMEYPAAGRTAVFDSVYMGLHHLRKARHGRRALLVFTDGEDNSSRYTRGGLKDLVRESDVQIYAIGFETRKWIREDSDRSPEEPTFTSRVVTEIAKESGGRHFLVQNGSQMITMAEQIGEQLRNQYILGYSSSNKMRDGKYWPLRIELHQANGMGRLRIHARQGYHAPVQ